MAISLVMAALNACASQTAGPGSGGNAAVLDAGTEGTGGRPSLPDGAALVDGGTGTPVTMPDADGALPPAAPEGGAPSTDAEVSDTLEGGGCALGSSLVGTYRLNLTESYVDFTPPAVAMTFTPTATLTIAIERIGTSDYFQGTALLDMEPGWSRGLVPEPDSFAFNVFSNPDGGTDLRIMGADPIGTFTIDAVNPGGDQLDMLHVTIDSATGQVTDFSRVYNYDPNSGFVLSDGLDGTGRRSCR